MFTLFCFVWNLNLLLRHFDILLASLIKYTSTVYAAPKHKKDGCIISPVPRIDFFRAHRSQITGVHSSRSFGHLIFNASD